MAGDPEAHGRGREDRCGDGAPASQEENGDDVGGERQELEQRRKGHVEGGRGAQHGERIEAHQRRVVEVVVGGVEREDAALLDGEGEQAPGACVAAPFRRQPERDAKKERDRDDRVPRRRRLRLRPAMQATPDNFEHGDANPRSLPAPVVASSCGQVGVDAQELARVCKGSCGAELRRRCASSRTRAGRRRGWGALCRARDRRARGRAGGASPGRGARRSPTGPAW